MDFELVCKAFREWRCLELHSADGGIRTVEIHSAGYTKDGERVMRVWQTSNGSGGSDSEGWKLINFDEVVRAESGGPSSAPRWGYKRADEAIDRMICQV